VARLEPAAGAGYAGEQDHPTTPETAPAPVRPEEVSMTTRRAHRTALTSTAAVLAVLSLGACSQDTGAVDTDDAVETTDQDPTEPEAGIDASTLSFEELTEDLRTRVGEEVMVTARVERVVTPGVFLVNSLRGNALESVAVVDVEQFRDIEADSEIVFTARVERTLDLPQRVASVLDVQLEEEALRGYGDRPYLDLVTIHSPDVVN
jgi:hypothetical protein